MAQNHYNWQIGRTQFHIVHGNLFDVSAASLVNSEQTDFILAHDRDTVSGQIRVAYGEPVQKELDEQTQGKIHPPGTVLRTSGGKYDAIFHAGFHHPAEWLDENADDNGTEHLHVIRGCVRLILDQARASSISSVAFPLIGTGVFGLDPGLIAHGFFEDVIEFAQINDSHEMDIWLVENDESIFHVALEAGVQAWLTHVSVGSKWKPFNLGVPHAASVTAQCRVSDLISKRYLRLPL